MHKHLKIAALILLPVSLLFSVLFAINISHIFSKAYIPVIPVTPPPSDPKSSIQLRTFGFVTLTPTPLPKPTMPQLPQTQPTSSAPLSTSGNTQQQVPTCRPDRYCQMPPSINDSYRFVTCGGGTGKRWGSKELITVLQTVTKRWKQRYPNGHIKIHDLTAGNHLTHFWGTAADISATTNGADTVANYTTPSKYNRAATIELGKMFIDTGIIQTIWYDDFAVDNAVFAYARGRYNSGAAPRQRWVSNFNGNAWGMRAIGGHDWHFHVNILSSLKLARKNATCANLN